MIKLLILLSLFCNSAYALDLTNPIHVDSVFIDYNKYHPSNRDPLFYNTTKKETLSLNLNLDVLSFLYIDSRVHGDTDNSQYHLVGLEERIGVRVFKSLEIGWRHHSQHILDDKYPYQKFPVDDSFNIRLYLIGNSKRESLLE